MAVRDYSKGKIYKIVADTDEEYKPYVGSTIQGLAERMGSHRSGYKAWKKNKQTCCNSYDLFNRFGVENCKIILVEEYSCDSKMKLLMKEREWFDKMECCNQKKPYISKEERINYNKDLCNQNMEKIIKYKKEYYQANKEQIAEKGKEKFECDCGSICRKSDKTRHERSLKHQNWLKSL